ncbi:HAMP domain-containing protein [Leptospira fletcheri]|uniref:histidine kinase n=1 Tax=Leptospira fletcheri TaxID=2484981 RepID=A0A4R9GK11_9LEPT|nr:ATP-binding protein [Leptospira fletcheri]TGK14030.1 HAMP domain-containing protein [Leptospira fletcheri]
MNLFLKWLEGVFGFLPLPLLEVWGRFGYLVGVLLMLCAYGGLTFRPNGKWGIARERQIWDSQALYSMGLTFVSVFVTGYLGSLIVLVPGAQTFESVKDLSVFLCIVLFGYPALVVVPFAYGLSDLIEGVPPEFLADWILGYFINPSCFWVAYQFIGKNPDFKSLRTWGWYLSFVLIFMTIEPQLWGYICSDKFTPEISYRNISPALFFTTSVTWVFAPFGMLVFLPLARKYSLYWAEIPGHVREISLDGKIRIWESGRTERKEGEIRSNGGLPIRMLIASPFIVLVLVMVGMTAYLTLKSSEESANKLALRLHQEISENINLQLDDFLEKRFVTDDPPAKEISALLQNSGIARQGRAYILDRNSNLVSSSLKPQTTPSESEKNFAATASEDLVIANSVQSLEKRLGDLHRLRTSTQFYFDVITARPLSRETWLAQATPYTDGENRQDWIVVTALPESYYLAGVRTGNSQSAMVFAIGLLLSLLVAAFLSGIVSTPIARISSATEALARGEFSRRVPTSRLEEVGSLSSSFNRMAEQLQELIFRTKSSEERFRDLVETTPGIVWEASATDLDFIFVSSQADSLGFAVEEWTKPGFWISRIHPEDRERVIGLCKESIGKSESFEFEYRFVGKNEKVTWLKNLVKVIYEKEEPKYLRGVMVDVTKNKQAEETILDLNANLEKKIDQRTQELQKSNANLVDAVENLEKLMRELKDAQEQLLLSEKLAALGQLAAGMTHELNTPLGAIVSSNRAILEILQNDLKKLPGVFSDLGGEDLEIFRVLFEESLKDASQSQEIPDRAIRKDLLQSLNEARIKDAETITNLILDAGLYRIGEKTLLDLVKTDKVVPILSAVSTLSTIVRLSQVIKIATGKASHVVLALKNYLNPGALPLETMGGLLPVDVRSEIETVLTLYHSKIKSGVEIVKNFATEEECIGDADKLNQVWINLLNNGLQSMNYKGRLEIEIREENPWIITSFIDSGEGIPKEIQGKIFDPFFTTKRHGEGIGLGLDICKKIIEKMGGKIEFESVPGRTRFSVWLKSATAI